MLKMKLGSFRPVPWAQWNRNAVLLLITAQQPWHKFCCNAPHVKLIRQICRHIPHDSPTMLQTSWIVRHLSSRIASRTFATFSIVVMVKYHPKHSSSSIYIHLFLKHLTHSWVCIWPMALSPNASFSILCVSEAILPSLKQNLMQIPLLLHIILAGHYNHRTALTWHHKNSQKKHTCPHSKMPLGKIIHKR